LSTLYVAHRHVAILELSRYLLLISPMKHKIQFYAFIYHAYFRYKPFRISSPFLRVSRQQVPQHTACWNEDTTSNESSTITILVSFLVDSTAAPDGKSTGRRKERDLYYELKSSWIYRGVTRNNEIKFGIDRSIRKRNYYITKVKKVKRKGKYLIFSKIKENFDKTINDAVHMMWIARSMSQSSLAQFIHQLLRKTVKTSFIG